MMCQFYVHLPPTDSTGKPRLSRLMYQRSADLGLGIPFNIASYALLTHMVTHVAGTEAHELVIQPGARTSTATTLKRFAHGWSAPRARSRSCEKV